MTEDPTAFLRFEELFWQVTKDMGGIWKKIFDEHLPGSQSYILFLLEKKGQLRMSEIAEILRLTPGAVTSASDKLLEHGHLSRVRSEHDRRVVSLEITEQGKQTLGDLRVEGRKTMKRVFRDLSDPELNQLVGIFERAAFNLEALRKEQDA